jgi:hypothetical protein
MLMLVVDPFQVFGDDALSSACPILLVNLNVALHNRYKLGIGCHFFCFDMGPARKEKGKKGKKADVRKPYNAIMEPLVDELDSLDRVGFTVFDAFTNEEEVQLHVKPLLFLSDLRGLQSFMQCGGTPATYGCIKCWFRSIGKAGNDSCGKPVYNGHYSLLPLNHALREPLHQLHNTDNINEKRAKNDRSSIRYCNTASTCRSCSEPPLSIPSLTRL